MKVLYVYAPYNNDDVSTISFYEKLRGSFYAAFSENNTEFTIETIHFGKHTDIDNPIKMNAEILKKDFDICIVSEELDFAVDLSVIRKLGKKLFLCCWDTFVCTEKNIYENFHLMMKMPRVWGHHKCPVSIAEATQYCNFLIGDFGYGEFYPNVYAVSNPIDTRIYNADNFSEEQKDIEVGFNGMFYTSERDKYFEIFKQSDLNISFTGSNNKDFFPFQVLSPEDFVNIFKRTKISLSFNQSIFSRKNVQRKGRLFEIPACKSFLLTTHPEALSYYDNHWFKLGEHFDSFDEEDCFEKIQFYIDNPDIRIKMTNAMHQHFLDNYAPIHWWNNIFKWAKDK